MHHKHSARHTALAASLLFGLARADSSLSSETRSSLKQITVNATRTERRLDDVPATVTIVTRQDGEARAARDIKDLFADELDVAVAQGPNRYSIAGGNTNRAGNESINIRGLQGNQVLMMIDGIRVPASFSFGGFAVGRGDYLDTGDLQKAEILRGPATTQYGSDGLSGAVFFHTLEPRDLVKDGQSVGGFVKSGYNSVDRSWLNAAGFASLGADWQSLLQVSYRSGHEQANMGSNSVQNYARTSPNPADNNASNVLAKLARRLDGVNRLGLTVESLRRREQTEVDSARALPPYGASNNTLDLSTDDRVERDRVSLAHSYDDTANPLWQKLETQLYWQRAKVAQTSAETRYNAAQRTRDNAYISNTVGIGSQAQSTLPGPIRQRLSYGFDWSRSVVESPANGTVPPAGYAFPYKTFPDTTYTQGGTFAQDEIEFGTLSLIPGLRFDRYRLVPSGAGYGGSVVSLSDQAWSPRVGAVWRLMPQLAPYAQWARGFRAPTPDQVNLNFSNYTIPGRAYTSVGNPNLQAERATSMEVGLRGKLDRLRYSLTVYDNRYQDLISQQIVGGDGSSANPLVYQYVNLQDAHIHGWEVRTAWQIDERWQVKGGVAASRGDYSVKGQSQPLDTIQPLKAVLTLGYDRGRWGGSATVQHAAGRDAGGLGVQQGRGIASQYSTPAWTTLDLGAFWKPANALTLNAGINNVFNRKYWRWSDVRGLAGNDPALDGWSAPGRNAYLNVRYDF